MNLTESADSSTISRFGYDANSNTLGVEFKNGTQYHYYDVPESVFEQIESGLFEGAISSAKHQRCLSLRTSLRIVPLQV